MNTQTRASSSNLTNTNLHDALLRQGYVDVPLKNGKAGLFIGASFGSKTHYPLLLDTGSGHTSLDPKLMDLYHFKMTGRTIVGSGGGSNSPLHQVRIPILQLGNFISHHETADIANHSYSYLKLNNQSQAGLLGIDFLRAHSAVIDIKNQYLYLKPAGNNQLLSNSSAKYQKILLDAGYKSIKLERSPHSVVIIINAKVNNIKSAKFLLDSGCNPSLIFLDFINKHKLLHIALTDIGKSGSGGEMKMFKTSINKLVVGTVTWFPKNVLATNFQYIRVGVPIVGVIGLDWMRANHAIIDTGSDKVFIK